MDGGRADVAQLFGEKHPSAVELVVGHDGVAVAQHIDLLLTDHTGQKHDHLSLEGERALDDGEAVFVLGVHPSGDLAGGGRALDRYGSGCIGIAGRLARGFAGSLAG